MCTQNDFIGATLLNTTRPRSNDCILTKWNEKKKTKKETERKREKWFIVGEGSRDCDEANWRYLSLRVFVNEWERKEENNKITQRREEKRNTVLFLCRREIAWFSAGVTIMLVKEPLSVAKVSHGGCNQSLPAGRDHLTAQDRWWATIAVTRRLNSPPILLF